MLRNLVPRLVRSSNRRSRSARGGRWRSRLAIESLEERIALAVTAAITPADNVFGVTSTVGYLFQKLATVSITTDEFTTIDEFAFPTFEMDWDTQVGELGSTDLELHWSIVEIASTPGGITTIEGFLSGACNYLTAGTRSLTITAMDDASAVIASESFDIDVFAPPSSIGEITFFIAPPLGEPPLGVHFEGSTLTFEIGASLGAPITEFWVDWGDGVETGISPGTTSITHTYNDNSPFDGEYVLAIAAKVGGQTVAVFGAELQVWDIVPTVSIGDPGVTSIGQGETYTLDLFYDDVPADYPLQWTVYWDLLNPEPEVFDGNTSSVTHVYSEAGSYVILGQVMDKLGIEYSAFFFLEVTEVATLPTADAGGPYTTFADTPITLTGSVDDPTGLTFLWDLDGNDVFGETGEVGESVVFDPAGVAGTRTVKLKVTDGTTESEVSEATIEVLADGALVIDNELVVVGDAFEGVTMMVTLDGTTLSIETAAGTTTFDAMTFGDIRIRMGAGNDVVVIGANVMNTVYVDGGDGNDLIVGGGGRSIFNGGAGNDFLYGGAGDDILIGGDGNDQIFGGSGNDSISGGDGIDIIDGGSGFDLVIGGMGNDLVSGGSGEDILIGGWTIHDGDTAALDLIMATWTNGNSFNSRISELTGAGGLLQVGSAVFDDDALDILIGGAGRDLIFGDTNPFDGAFDLIALSLAQDRLIAVN